MMVDVHERPRHARPLPIRSIRPAYSQFCYEMTFMPGQTWYMDTPVIPTSAFAAGYNHPDCAYPDATPAISRVDGDGDGPYVSAAGHTLTITALGDQQVNNYGYSGPNQTAAPYNQKTVTRHYGFGATQGTGIGDDRRSHCYRSCRGVTPRSRVTVPSLEHVAVNLHDRAAHEPGERRKLCPLRTAGHHRRQRQAFGGYQSQ